MLADMLEVHCLFPFINMAMLLTAGRQVSHVAVTHMKVLCYDVADNPVSPPSEKLHARVVCKTPSDKPPAQACSTNSGTAKIAVTRDGQQLIVSPFRLWSPYQGEMIALLADIFS